MTENETRLRKALQRLFDSVGGQCTRAQAAPIHTEETCSSCNAQAVLTATAEAPELDWKERVPLPWTVGPCGVSFLCLMDARGRSFGPAFSTGSLVADAYAYAVKCANEHETDLLAEAPKAGWSSRVSLPWKIVVKDAHIRIEDSKGDGVFPWIGRGFDSAMPWEDAYRYIVVHINSLVGHAPKPFKP